MTHQLVQRAALPDLRRKPTHDTEEFAAGIAPNRLLQLQRVIGNSGVRALLAKQATAAPRPPVVQRFWGDDEESEGGSSDSGGSWLDQATETVSSWVSGGDSDTDSGGGGGSDTEYGGGSSDYGGGSDSDSSDSEYGGGSSDYGGGSDSEYGDSDSESSSDESESESEDSDEGGGFWDWLPDLPDIDIPPIFGGKADEDMPTGEIELPEIQTVVEGLEEGTASCVSGHGDASGGGVSVAGKTSADFANATANASLNNPKIAKRKDGAKTVYDVTGTIHIDYALPGEPTVAYTVNPPKGSLTDCKREKVDAFIAGDLGTHEGEHVKAFKTFNGGEDHSVSFTGLEASSTAELTQKVQAEVDNFVKGPNGKVKARQQMAQGNSDKLDPWSKPIPGIGSCP